MLKKPVKKRKIAPKPKITTLMDRLPKNHGEWLSVVIQLTRRAGKGMEGQLARLEKELEEWKAAN